MFVIAALALPAGAAARFKSISATLSKPGYTVLALTPAGKATSVLARTGRFSIRPPAGVVTLQLRTTNGKYAGPVVLGIEQRAQRVIVGVRAGAKLGRIDVNVRAGYARVRGKLTKAFLVATRWARAKRGVPIGNGRNFGFVRSKPPAPRARPLGDIDADGVPDVLDIDANGNLILNNLDRSITTRAAQVANAFQFASELPLSISQTANVDAGSTDADINAVLPSELQVRLGIVPGGPVELDCGHPQSRTDPKLGGLVYCSKGGTGRVIQPGTPYDQAAHFPDCCDPDNNGFGTLTPAPGSINPQSPGGVFWTWPGATSSQIGTGDLLIERQQAGESLATLQYLFVTVPALASYSDNASPQNSGTVHYPVAPTNENPPPGGPPFIPGGPGTHHNGIAVGAGPDGHVVLTLKFWRPQRQPIGQETAPWIDMGGLTYLVRAQNSSTKGPLLGKTCPQNALSADPSQMAVAKFTPYFQAPGGLTDLEQDRAANPNNMITFTLDMTKCLAAYGLSWDVGEELDFDFVAATGVSDDTLQDVTFKRTS